MKNLKSIYFQSGIMVLGVICATILFLVQPLALKVYVILLLIAVAISIIVAYKYKIVGLAISVFFLFGLMYVVQKSRLRSVIVLVPQSYEGYISIGFLSKNSDDVQILDKNAIFDMRENTCRVFKKKYYKPCYNLRIFVAESMTSDKIPDSSILLKRIDTIRGERGNEYWLRFLVLRENAAANEVELKELEKIYHENFNPCK
jgi:hypothetical protein